MKEITINYVEQGSIADELGLEVGDILLNINGKTPKDLLEYRFLINDEFLLVEIKKTDGEIWELEIEKDYDEDLGIKFKDELIDKPKSCHNNCVFCFINQLPEGMRDSLYFKDDDTRLSFLYGNYVTLTNLNDKDIDRIIEYRLQPINISVHTTNEELRVKMLGNKRAANVNKTLEKFYANGISMNIQIVLVPDYNDGKELEKTLSDLSKYYPYINSICVVPVGLTKYREKLTPLRPFTKGECQQVVKKIEEKRKFLYNKYKEKFIFASDEFFIKGDLPIPNTDYYGDFAQLENGVGMMSLFMAECNDALNEEWVPTNTKASIITGELAYPYINKIVQDVIKKYPQMDLNVIAIKNDFFGPEITVSGLITGRDIINQLKNKELHERILFPSNMLRFEGDVFLDDLTVDKLNEVLNKKCTPVDLNGREFISSILIG